jgi:hypothetical protein
MHRTFLLILAVTAFCISAVSGLIVSGENVSSNLTSGNAMSASLEVNILTFPSDNYLTLTTDLTTPTWSFTTVIDGSSNSLGSAVNITGSQLSFPNATSAVLQVSLTGTIPVVTSSTSKKVIQIQQFEASGTQAGGTYLLDRTIVPAVTPIPTTATTGNISVTSSPSGSKVYLDDDYLGTTPYNITGLTPGNYTVVVKRSGYLDNGKKILLIAGETELFDADLVLQPTVTLTTAAVTTTTTTTPTKTATNTPLKTFTPWPSDTPTPESPLSSVLPLISLCGIAFLVIRKK